MTAKEVFYKRWWSGVLIDQGFMDLDITHCPNPRGFTGFRGLDMASVSWTSADPGKPTPIGDVPTDFYGGPDFVSRTSPGYDYSMAWTLLNKAVTSSARKMPTLTNAAIPERCVLAMEWNFYEAIPHVNFSAGEGFGCTTMGGMTGKPDWSVRFVRHMYAKFGGNNVAFGDLHVASIEPRFDNEYYYAFGENPTQQDPRELYPMIAFYSKWRNYWETDWGGTFWHVSFAWNVAHTD